ncbi:Gfo/Idh/MocA family oxidoreductase [Microlunatus elymi]|uniref:Gfo/Idh/MocA family oxidoreductase n=1 Tax=Microlunatus elymi TaxID=2596828 RepID=A0A516PVF5_9ACTN|nr:Gfo/Idh/MocA family oxidoreductase [Microlunatus elymi]QDP95178.1 Gfo/Idh/MocA family oxidoreductase [Microlunatus elymi]
MIKIGIAGLGKMGLSHQAILGAHPQVEVAGICDTNSYLLGVLHKYTGVPVFNRLETMLDEADLDALVVATPSRLHAPMVRLAIDHGLHIFCEKPFCLSTADGTALANAAADKNLVTQVGYHNRFVGAFAETKRLIDNGAIGDVTHALAEAYGPVVLRPSGGTWRSQRSEGGGCLYDYAAHPINLINWYLGTPLGAGGTVLNRVFSREIDDEVASTLYFDHGRTAQISVSWSDESVRKMSTQLTLWGTEGRISVDRQECRVYLRDGSPMRSSGPGNYQPGWNVKYTTELTEPVDFYLRGEEYSAELSHFITRCEKGEVDGENSFESSVITDRTIETMIIDAQRASMTRYDESTVATPARGSSPRGGRVGRLARRLVRR